MNKHTIFTTSIYCSILSKSVACRGIDINVNEITEIWRVHSQKTDNFLHTYSYYTKATYRTSYRH